MYDEPNRLDKKSLQTQLENYKLIAEVNADLIDESLFAKEELAKNLELAQSYINESCQWEKIGDPTKYDDALSNAKIIIMEITAVIKRMLNQDILLDNSNLECS